MSEENIDVKKESHKIYKDELKKFKSSFKSEFPKCYISKKKDKPTSDSPNECHAKIKYSSNGKIYIGELKKFENGKYYYHGQGFFTYAYNTKNQIVYRGQWVKGKKQGEGIQTKLNEKYAGYWHLNKYHGHGTLTLGNGNEKTGEWVKGNLENENLGKVYCQKSNLDTYYINLGSSNDCLPDKEISFEQYKKIAEEEVKDKYAYEASLGYQRVACKKRSDVIGKDCGWILTGKKINVSKKPRVCQLWNYAQENKHICSENIQQKKTASFGEFALSLGCGSKVKNVDDCVRRYLPALLGTAPMAIDEVNEFKKDKELMGEVVKIIVEINRVNSQSQQEPTEEEKAFAQAQEQGLINNQNFYKMYDPILEKHLNSRGWTQVNPKLEKILNSIGRSQIPIKNQKRFTTITGWKF